MARMSEEEYFKLTGQKLPKKQKLSWEPKRNKMGNQKTEDGYDSKLEQSRAGVLRMEQKLGIISNLQEQKKFVLQEAFKIPSENTKSGLETVRAITYSADFVYNKVGEELPIVEDTKGHRTDVFKIKKKMFLKKFQGQYKFIETSDKHGTITR